VKSKVVHDRLSYYIERTPFNECDYEDGYYRYMVYLQVDNKNDLIRVKRAQINKFLGLVGINGKEMAPEEAFDKPKFDWQGIWIIVSRAVQLMAFIGLSIVVGIILWDGYFG